MAVCSLQRHTAIDMIMEIPEKLVEHVENCIIPRYASFDKAHRRDHVMTVLEQSMELAKHYDVDMSMVYAIAAYHDTGLCEGRERHHTESARIVRNDECLKELFTPEQIEVMADAVEDHRASNNRPPRTIYGRIVAEADRVIDAETIMRRTIQYGLAHHPALDKEEQLERAIAHIKEKYGHNGYLKLWIPESSNAANLERFRVMIDDEAALREALKTILDKENCY